MRDTIIHPSAIVDTKARLGAGVRVGPFCVVGPDVILGDGTELVSHVSIVGRSELGPDCKVYPFASVGSAPQDLKYRGEPSRLVIGSRTVIRESSTINPGTEGGGMLTSIGDDCLLMANSHVAHDCRVGNHVVIATFAGCAGHCELGDYVILGGMAGLHQRVRIGRHAFVGAHTLVDADVIPYGMVVGNRGTLVGLNLVGLKRHGHDREAIQQLRSAYKIIFAKQGTLRERAADAAQRFFGAALVGDVVDFIARGSSDRSILLPEDNGTDDT